MSIVTDVVSAVEGISAFLSDVLHSNMASYNDVETADSKHALANRDGSLVSGIRVEGMITAPGSQEFEAVVTAVDRAFQSYLRDEGCSVQFFFARDPENTRALLDGVTQGSRRTASELRMEVNDVIDSSVDALSRHCASEAMYVGLWTTDAVLTKKDRQTAASKRKESLKHVEQFAPSAQDIFAGLPELREKHNAFYESVRRALESAGFIVELLTGHEMLRAARNEIDPDFTPKDWSPCLPGDPIPKLFRNRTGPGHLRNLDISDVQYPPVDWQLFPRNAEKINSKYVQIGDRVYAPLFIEIPPREIMPFSNLFMRLADTKIPWRISFLLDGGGVRYLGLKGSLSKYIKWASHYNAQIADCVDQMTEVTNSGKTAVRMRVALCTWAKAGDLEQLSSRVSRLATAAASWGQAEVREVSGDPMAGFMSSVPFVTRTNIANYSVMPIDEIARMLPIMRPASPWKSGGVLYRTREGKLMPFQPGGTEQSTWNYIIFALPGMGKSNLMAALLFAGVIQAGIKRLPRIAIIDIGPSSKGLIHLVRDALPENLKHYAGHFRLRMTPEFAINPWDTQLGMRYPTPEHRSFLINIMTQMATPPEAKQSYDSISQVASKIVDFLYKQFSDDSKASPRRYASGPAPEVDKILADFGMEIVPRQTTWWEVVDYLFQKHAIHEATIAQRHAMPRMSDVGGAANDKAIDDLYNDVKVSTGESLNKAFARLISDALRDYSILTSPTAFDIGDARICAIDIDEVAKGGGKSAEHQTSLMYLIARYALTKDFKLDPSMIADVPQLYKEYHTRRVNEIKEDMKWIAYDEFHKTNNSPAIINEVMEDMRVGRKWKIGVILASQGVDDFPEAAKEFATGYFILNAGTDRNADALQALLGFNETAKALLLKYAHGPTPDGAPFLAHLRTKIGTYSQLLYSTMGPIQSWAFSTTMEDALVRERVSTSAGPVAARSALAAKYPRGAAAEVQRLRLHYAENNIDKDPITEISSQVLTSIGP